VTVLVLLLAPPSAASAETRTHKTANAAVERSHDDRDEGRPRQDTHRTVTNEDVTWTIPAGQCPTLPAGSDVNGRGRRHAVTTTTARRDGSTVVVVDDVVRGTAEGGQGRAYRFSYANHTTEIRPPSGSGRPVQVHMIDSFVLHGRGGVAVDAAFDWLWTYTPPPGASPPVGQWPPHDNWRKLSTRGDSFLCDPI
jgi:hypothetical protein